MSKLFSGLSGWDWLEILSLAAVSSGAICALILRSRKSKIAPDKNGLIPVSIFFEKEKVESKKHRWELFWEIVLIAGLIGEIPATKHSISESARLNNENLVLQTNVESLNDAVIQLAHQYDLSTNALAEANARLAAIRSLKDRLIDWLNVVDPSIIPALKGGKTIFQLNNIPEYKFNMLAALLYERGIRSYVFSVTNTTPASVNIVAGIGQVEDLTIELKPELAQ